MYRLLLGLGSLVLVAMWDGAASVYAQLPDFVVEGVITETGDVIQKITLTVTNNTADFFVKGFAITLGTATRADTELEEWDAAATNDNPIEGLEGSGGAITHFEYVFYHTSVADNYLVPGGNDNRFTFERDFPPNRPPPPFDPLPLGILVVDQNGVESICLGTTGSDGCNLRIQQSFCGGHPVTLMGTPGHDDLLGTAEDDVIAGLGGNDTINGLGGNDVICGGPGHDVLLGGSGHDTLFGGSGNDTLIGEYGNDELFGGHGNDTLSGGDGIDLLFGEAGNDTLLGGENTDVLLGGPGNDTCQTRREEQDFADECEGATGG
jgi:Ca2+-binding RTX toxin-like protein